MSTAPADVKGVFRMNRGAVLLPALAMTGAALAATLMGCAAPATPASVTPASAALGARPSAPAVTHPAASAPATQPPSPGHSPAPSPTGHSPVPHAPGHSPAPSPHGTGSLTNGLYTDAPDGYPHYVLALSLGKGDAITGSVNFFYQDGRIGPVGQYTGELSGGGMLTITFGDGKDLTGTYAQGTFTLASCRSVLAQAVNTAGCTFAYHGHVP